MEEKRKLKPQRSRRPSEKLNLTNVYFAISEETGFTVSDIKKVLNNYFDVINQGLHDKKTVLIPRVGTLFPSLKPERIGVSLKGGQGAPEKIIVPAAFRLRFMPSATIKDSLAKVEVTPEELEDIYIKED